MEPSHVPGTAVARLSQAAHAVHTPSTRKYPSAHEAHAAAPPVEQPSAEQAALQLNWQPAAEYGLPQNPGAHAH